VTGRGKGVKGGGCQVSMRGIPDRRRQAERRGRNRRSERPP